MAAFWNPTGRTPRRCTPARGGRVGRNGWPSGPRHRPGCRASAHLRPDTRCSARRPAPTSTRSEPVAVAVRRQSAEGRRTWTSRGVRGHHRPGRARGGRGAAPEEGRDGCTSWSAGRRADATCCCGWCRRSTRRGHLWVPETARISCDLRIPNRSNQLAGHRTGSSQRLSAGEWSTGWRGSGPCRSTSDEATMIDAPVGCLKQPGAGLERVILERDLEPGSFRNRPQRSRTDFNRRA